MFKINLKDQKLPGFTDLLDIDVSISVITLTDGTTQSQWSIEIPQSGARLPGTEPLPPLFKGVFPMPSNPEIVDKLKSDFVKLAPALVANLNNKANDAKAT